eukprot:6204977-Pleurochrysis_carterae.AAC.8
MWTPWPFGKAPPVPLSAHPAPAEAGADPNNCLPCACALAACAALGAAPGAPRTDDRGAAAVASGGLRAPCEGVAAAVGSGANGFAVAAKLPPAQLFAGAEEFKSGRAGGVDACGVVFAFAVAFGAARADTAGAAADWTSGAEGGPPDVLLFAAEA